jgi:glycosyltransferase involved in cell wall biosynthesis
VHVLRDVLLPRVNALLFVHHPLQYQRLAHGRRSRAEAHGRAAGARLVPSPPPIGVEPLSYVKDVLLTLIWTLQCRMQFDLFVGAGNLNAFAGLLLRRLGRVRRVVYYAIDYQPRRFDNPFLERIYRAVEAVCVRHCDATWSLSSAMIESRRASGITSPNPQLVVPIGTFPRPAVALDPTARRRIVFVGNVIASHGLDLVIRALPEVLRGVPDARLDVYGDGPQAPILRTLAAEVRVAPAVRFHGHVSDRASLGVTLARGGVGVATYDPTVATFTRYADPGKIKDYLAAHLPIVMTDVPPNAVELNGDCAVVIQFDVRACAQALIRLLTDDTLYARMAAAAARRAEALDWERVFTRALTQTPA